MKKEFKFEVGELVTHASDNSSFSKFKIVCRGMIEDGFGDQAPIYLVAFTNLGEPRRAYLCESELKKPEAPKLMSTKER